MKYVLASIASMSALPAMAHSGAHLHPHGAETWLAVVLAAIIAGGIMTYVWNRAGKGPWQ